MVEHLTPSQIKDFKEVFSVFDVDGDGTITVKELDNVMRSLGQKPTEDQIKAMVKDVDTDGNGTVDFNEFVLLMSKKLQDVEMETEIFEAFRIFDRDRDGHISSTELRSAMLNLGERISDEEVNELIQFADLNGDGKIDYKEFARMLTPR